MVYEVFNPHWVRIGTKPQGPCLMERRLETEYNKDK